MPQTSTEASSQGSVTQAGVDLDLDTLELTILMPCLDEAETLGTCIRKARGFLDRAGIDGEVLIADNGSTDGSTTIAARGGARVVHVPERGYGAALIAGIEAARGRYIVMGDADDSYDFSDLTPFVDQLRDGADLVMGNRFRGGIRPGAMPGLHRYLGNPVLSRIGRLLFGSPAGDFHCGLRGFRRDSALALDLRTTGMEFASELVVKATLTGQRIEEVPIVLYPDGRSRPPHLRSWRDGWRHLRFLLLYSPRWLFLYPGALAMAAGVAGLVALGSTAWMPGHGRFAEGLLVAAGGLVIAGFQATLFAVLARVFAATERLLPPQDRLSRLFRVVTLEVGLLAGAGLLLIGIAGVSLSLGISTTSDPRSLEPTLALRLGVCAVTCAVLGMQVVLGSFFLSLLGLKRLGSPDRLVGG
jgi:hypothetical protein